MKFTTEWAVQANIHETWLGSMPGGVAATTEPKCASTRVRR